MEGTAIPEEPQVMSSPPPSPPSPSSSSSSRQYDEAFAQLAETGYAVVRGAVPPQRCREYYERFWDWLEAFGTGIDRTDRDTWRGAAWPVSIHGIFQHYGVGHQPFVWDVRREEGIVDAFAALWGTRSLLVSFDGANLSKPSRLPQSDWGHTDQRPDRHSPRASNPGRPAFRLHPALAAVDAACVQGSLCLVDCGPQDGGLVVRRGSHLLHARFFETYPRAADATRGDWYKLAEADRGFYAGCPPDKVCCAAGDLVLWDSRAIHHAVAPSGERCRSAVYVCYMPAALATPRDLEKKRAALANRRTTLHWPCRPKLFPERPRTYGRSDRLLTHPVDQGTQPVVLDELGRRLAGAEPYPRDDPAAAVGRRQAIKQTTLSL